jgi:hypothetical protein
MTGLPPDAANDLATGRRNPLLIPLAAGVAVLPLVIHGCSCGHDFDFHLISWMEAASQFSHGNLHPHWAYSPAFNAGEPRFVFYPPLSWALGALLGLLLTHLPGITPAAGWNATPILFTWIALTLSGCTLYRFARVFMRPNAALFAAILYLANPYMLFTAYERTAYAELLSAAWIPLLFFAILRDKVTVPGIALPISLLWLTNAPAAVMGSYTLALLAIIRAVATYRAAVGSSAPNPTFGMWAFHTRPALQISLNALAGTALGMSLAAFYIIPAAYERRFVQISMSTIAGMRIDKNFLFEHTGTSSDALLHDQVLHTASLIAIIILVATAAALAAVVVHRNPPGSPLDTHSGESRPYARFPTLAFIVLSAGIAILLTPLSTPIWNHAPELAFLQFPWRLLAILAPIFALSVAASIGRFPLKFATMGIALTALAGALAFPAYYFFRQPCDEEDTAPARSTLFQSHAGMDPTDEYTPITADNDALKPNHPPYWLASEPTALARSATQAGLAPSHLTVNAAQPEFLILNLRDYPAWHVFLNGALDPAREQRDDGLLALPIPAGVSTIDIRYAQTIDQTLGNAITVLALALYLFTLSRERRRPGRPFVS